MSLTTLKLSTIIFEVILLFFYKKTFLVVLADRDGIVRANVPFRKVDVKKYARHVCVNCSILYLFVSATAFYQLNPLFVQSQ